ncbi:MAG: hypothetical protein QW304_06375 [Thermoproteota archaeon]
MGHESGMRMGVKPFAVACIFLLLVLKSYSILISAQLEGMFQVTEEDNEVEVAYLEAGLEKFKVIINKNGGIAEVQVSNIPYTSVAGTQVWSLWEQTWNTDPMAPPVVVNKGDYVEARFYGKYRTAELYVKTNYTISKTGLILVSSIIEAKRDEPLIMQTAWMVYFSTPIFANEKAYIKFEKEVTEVQLPASVTSGSFYGGQDVVYWVDFSKPTAGIAFINMAPGSEDWYETTVRDERQYGYHDVYSVYFAHTAYGEGAMSMGDKRVSKVALYIHGQGGYEGNKEILDLISDIASTSVECEKALKNVGENTEAGRLASQAMENVNSGLEKLLKGDFEGSETDLGNAKKLLEEVKGIGGVFEKSLPAIVGVIVIVVIIVVIVTRRRKAKKTIS